ncbi:hypothetical protein SEA_CHASER_70 [Mycobacterium phage Chaser]|nr:hypothetical protein SEA_CHASER_70 [Mycobacterium phage Chaser]
MTEPDEDYENPIGEVLDEDTAHELASEHFTSELTRILTGRGLKPWPFS